MTTKKIEDGVEVEIEPTVSAWRAGVAKDIGMLKAQQAEVNKTLAVLLVATALPTAEALAADPQAAIDALPLGNIYRASAKLTDYKLANITPELCSSIVSCGVGEKLRGPWRLMKAAGKLVVGTVGAVAVNLMHRKPKAAEQPSPEQPAAAQAEAVAPTGATPAPA